MPRTGKGRFKDRSLHPRHSAEVYRQRPVFGGFLVRARIYRYAAFALILGSLLAAAFADMSLPM